MRRLFLFATLLGLLSIVPESFAQSRLKHATIKYEDGSKYVGEIQKGGSNGKKKIKYGKGIMYFVNGDQFDGEWYNDQCKRGTYKFAYGDIFEGEISKSSI